MAMDEEKSIPGSRFAHLQSPINSPSSKMGSQMEGTSILLNNFNISTWLTMGACLQCILFIVLPRYVALLPAFVFLTSRLVHVGLVTQGWAKNPLLPPEQLLTKVTAPIPNEDGTQLVKAGEREVVCFLVGSNCNHPMGVFSPGFKVIAKYFSDMWVEADTNREKWGFLGKSTITTMPTPGGGSALITISYWRSIDHLHAFAASPLHKAGWEWFGQITKKWPHIGILHETFEAKERGWENVYKNSWPVGMGQAQHLVRESPDAEPRWVNSLMPAKGGRWKTMRNRMGTEEGFDEEFEHDLPTGI
ncbi:hypothetical protein ACLMJK_001016 [Lecanora helva]